MSFGVGFNTSYGSNAQHPIFNQTNVIFKKSEGFVQKINTSSAMNSPTMPNTAGNNKQSGMSQQLNSGQDTGIFNQVDQFVDKAKKGAFVTEDLLKAFNMNQKQPGQPPQPGQVPAKQQQGVAGANANNAAKTEVPTPKKEQELFNKVDKFIEANGDKKLDQKA